MRSILFVTLTGAAALGISPSLAAANQAQDAAPAVRPGDDQMSCEAIIAEMKTLNATGVSAATRAEAKEAGEAMKAEMDRQKAAAAAQMAAQGAATAAASAAAAAGMQGADAALLAGQIAAQAQGAQNLARMEPKRERAQRAIEAATAELHAGMQANPRFGRLIGLAGAKGCSGNF